MSGEFSGPLAPPASSALASPGGLKPWKTWKQTILPPGVFPTLNMNGEKIRMGVPEKASVGGSKKPAAKKVAAKKPAAKKAAPKKAAPKKPVAKKAAAKKAAPKKTAPKKK